MGLIDIAKGAIRYGANPLGLAAAGALAVGYTLSQFSDQQPNTLAVGYNAVEHLADSLLFRDPYENLVGNSGQRFIPRITGIYSDSRQVFYEGGSVLKPLKVEDDTVLRPSDLEGRKLALAERRERHTSNDMAIGIGSLAGAGATASLTAGLDALGSSIYEMGSPRRGRFRGSGRYAASLFEEGMLEGEGLSLGKNFMPIALGAAVGGYYGGMSGAIAGTAIGSYVGSYIFMKDAIGPGLKKYPAALIYGALAGGFIANTLTARQETISLTAPGVATSDNKVGYLRPDLYKSFNPYSAVRLIGRARDSQLAPYILDNPNTLSSDYHSLSRMLSLNGDFTPNYRSNAAYRLRFYNDSTKRHGQTNSFDYINPIFMAESASFLTVGMTLLAAKQIHKVIPRNTNKLLKDSLGLLGLLNDYDAHKEVIASQEAAIESGSRLVRSLMEGRPRTVMSSSMRLATSSLSVVKSHLISEGKFYAISGIAALAGYHFLSNWQEERRQQIAGGNNEYAQPSIVDNSGVGVGALVGGVVGVGLGGGGIRAASTISRLVGTRASSLLLPLAFGTVGVGLGVFRTDHGRENEFYKPIALGSVGVGAGVLATMLSKRYSATLSRYALPLGGLLGIAGVITGSLSARRYVDNPNYKPTGIGSPLNIYEGAVPEGTSDSDRTKVQNFLDRSRYYYEGIATPTANGNIFYDSGTIGKGFMSFLQGAPKSSLMGSFYELSADQDFLRLLSSKAAPGGIGVSMGGNVQLLDLEGAATSLIYGATHGFGLSSLTGRLINTFSQASGFGKVYKDLGEEGYKQRTIGGMITNAALYGAVGVIAAPTALAIASKFGLRMGGNKALLTAGVALASALAGGLFSKTYIDPNGMGQTAEGLEAFGRTPLAALQAYALTVGQNVNSNKNKWRHGDLLDQAFASVGRTIFTGGIDVTDKTVPLLLGERYEGGKTTMGGRNIIVHSKTLVTTAESGIDAAFVSTGNVGQMMDNYRGKEEQINFAMLIRDPVVVHELRAAVTAINSITPQQSLANVAQNLKHVIMGGQGANSIQRLTQFIDKSQGPIYAAMAYPSSPEIGAAFIRKAKAGTPVTLLVQNPYGIKGGGNRDKTRNLYRSMIHEGVNIYMLPKGSDLLVHAKAIYTPNEEYVGSHNESAASDNYVVELGVAMQDAEAGKAGIQAIKRVIGKYGFSRVQDNPELFREFSYSKDYKKYKDRLARDPFYSLVRPAVLSVLDDDLKKYQGLLYFPTHLPDGFAAKYPAGNPQFYADAFYSVTGRMPTGFQRYLVEQADNQLNGRSEDAILGKLAMAARGVPGIGGLLSAGLGGLNTLLRGDLGSSINKMFPGLYDQGAGLIPTLMKGVGRIVDTATGFYSEQYYERVRNHQESGGISGFHKNQYQGYNQDRGLFENTLGALGTGVGSTAFALAFYFGVSHTVSIGTAHMEDVGVDYITNLLSRPADELGSTLLKSYFFSGEVLNTLDSIGHAHLSTPRGQQLHDYFTYVMHKAGEASPRFAGQATTQGLDAATISHFDNAFIMHGEYTERLVDRMTGELNARTATNFADAAGEVEREVLGLNRSTGEFSLGRGFASGVNRPGSGLFAAVASIRKVDLANFTNIVRPMIQQMAVGTATEMQELNDVLNNLQEQVGKAPYLKYANLSNGIPSYLDELKPSEYGYDRLERIARSMDQIAEYIPANPLYYFKPYRDVSGISTLKVDKGNGEIESHSLRSLLGPGFSGLTKFTKRAIISLRGVGNGESLVSSLAQHFKLFEMEQGLHRTEQRLYRDAGRLLKSQALQASVQQLEGVTSSSNTTTLLQDLTEGLYGSQGTVALTVDQLMGNASSKKLIEDYSTNLGTYEGMLRKVDHGTSQLHNAPRSTFRSLRGALFSVGPLLILDKVLDPQFMQSPGMDLISQVFTDAGLLHDRGTRYGQMDYEGTVPGYIKYPAMAAGFLLGGHMLPNFQRGNLTATGLIERAINQSSGSSVSVLSILNAARPGVTPQPSLLSEAGNDLLKVIGRTRVSTRFGWMGGFIGGAAALLGTQAAFGMGAGLLNLFRSPFRDEGPSPQQEPLMAAFSLAAGIRQRINRDVPISRSELGLMDISYSAAMSMMYGKQQQDPVVYPFSTQVPNPLFRFSIVSKVDPRGNAVTIGAGFHFLPILGSGTLAPAPFEFRLRPLVTRASQRKADMLAAAPIMGGTNSEMYDDYRNSAIGGDVLSLLSFPGQLISISKDNAFSQMISFVGASSYVSTSVNRAEGFIRSNAGAGLKRELAHLKPLYNLARFSFSSIETLGRYSQVPLLAMPNTLMKGAQGYLNIPEEVLAKYGARARVLAPYLLAYTFASGITGPDSSFSSVGGQFGSNYAASEAYRFGAVVAPITAIYGYGLHNAGVFARADSFGGVTGNGFMASKQKLLYQMSQDAALGGKELPLLRSAATRLSMASRRIFTISALLAAGGLALRPLTRSGLGFLDVISDSEAPPIDREEVLYRRTQGFHAARYKPANWGEAASNYGDYLLRSLGGVLGLDQIVHREDKNAFLGIGGPFGGSQSGNSGFRLYTRAKSTFADVSGSVTPLGEALMSADLSMQMASIIGGTRTTNYDTEPNLHLFSDRYQRFRGAVARMTPSRLYGDLASSEYQSATGSTAFIQAISYRKALVQGLRYQRPTELTLDILLESAISGRLASRFGNTTMSYSPLATLGAISGQFNKGTSNTFSSLINSLGSYISNLGGGSQTNADTLLLPDQQQERTGIPGLDMFTGPFSYLLRGSSGKTTPGATGVLGIEQVPLLLATLATSSTFGTQLLAAGAAYHQGGVGQDALRQAQDKYFDFHRRRSLKVGYREIEGEYSLSIEPKVGKLVKPKILSLSSTMLQEHDVVVPGEALDVTSRKVEVLASHVERRMKNYYKEVARFLNPAASADLGAASLGSLHTGTTPTAFVDEVKNYLTQQLLERNTSFSGATTGALKLHEAFSIPDTELGVLLGTLDGLDVEIAKILLKDVSPATQTNQIRVAVASKLQNFDQRLFENASVGYLSDSELRMQADYTPEIGLERKVPAGLSGSSLSTAEIIERSGYIGLAKEGFSGAGRLANQAVLFSPLYSVFSSLTKAAFTSDSLEKSRAAGAAAYYTAQLPQIGLGYIALQAAFANPAVGITLTLAGVSLYLVDQYLNKGAGAKGISTAASWVDKNVGSPSTRIIANFYNFLANAPGTSQALAVLGLPFRVLDPMIEGLWASVKDSPAGYMALSFILPQTVDQVYDLYAAQNPMRNRAGIRMELLSPAEVQQHREDITRQYRQRAATPRVNLMSELSPGLLGGIGSESERIVHETYFDGGTRVLSGFSGASYTSDLLQMAIGRRTAIADFSGYGSYRVRRNIDFDKLGATTIALSGYHKSSLAYDGTYSGLLKRGMNHVGDILNKISSSWSGLRSWVGKYIYRNLGLSRLVNAWVTGTAVIAARWRSFINQPAITNTLNAVRNPYGLWTGIVFAGFVGSEFFDKKGKHRGMRAAVAGGTLAAGYGAIYTYQSTPVSTRTAIIERINNFRLTLPTRAVRGLLPALSAYAVTALVSRMAVGVIGLIGSSLNPDDKDGADRFYKYAETATNPLIAAGVAGITYAASFNNRVASKLARTNVAFFKGLGAAAFGGSAYALTAFAASEALTSLVGLPFWNNSDYQNAKENVVTGSTITFGLLGALRYGTGRPFRAMANPVSRWSLLGSDFGRVKAFGRWLGSGIKTLSPAPVTTLATKLRQLPFITSTSNFLRSQIARVKAIGAIPWMQSVGSRATQLLGRLRGVGSLAYNLAPTVMDIGFLGVAGYQVSQLGKYSTRQQFRAQFSNVVSSSTNALIGSLLALRMRSPLSALVLALGSERILNPVLGAFLGDAAYSSRNQALIKDGTIAVTTGLSALSAVQGGAFAINKAFPTVTAGWSPTARSILGITSRPLANEISAVGGASRFAGWKVAGRLPVLSALLSSTMVGLSVGNMVREATGKPQDYRLTSQSLGKDWAATMSAAVNAAGVFGGALGIVGTGVLTYAAEPTVSHYLSVNLEQRMRASGKNSNRSAHNLQIHAAIGGVLGALLGVGAGIGIAAAAAASAPVLIAAGVLGLAAGAVIGIWTGVEKFFWGTKGSSIYKGQNATLSQQAAANASLGYAQQQQKKLAQTNSSQVLIASAIDGVSDVGGYLPAQPYKDDRNGFQQFFDFIGDNFKAGMHSIADLTRRGLRKAKQIALQTASTVNQGVNGLYSSATNLLSSMFPPSSSPKVVMQRTGMKDEYGLDKIAMIVYGDGGRVVGQFTVNSGIRSTQSKFGKGGTTRSGSLAPVEYGTYNIGGEVPGANLAAVGSIFMPLTPTFRTERASIGIHLDANRRTSPGSAGCVVFATKQEFDNFRMALRVSHAKQLTFLEGQPQRPVGLLDIAAGSQNARNMIGSIPNAVSQLISGQLFSAPPTPGSILWGHASQYSPSNLSGLTGRGKAAMEALKNPHVRAFLDAIAIAENGEIANTTGGYGVLVGHELKDTFNPNTLMSHPMVVNRAAKSSATGRYQFMDFNWKPYSRMLGLRDFKPQSQEIFAVGMLMDAGILGKIEQGNIASIFHRASSIWASLQGNPYSQGTSGGHTGTFMANYQKFLRLYSSGGMGYQAVRQLPQTLARAFNTVSSYLMPSTGGSVNQSARTVTRDGLAAVNSMNGRQVYSYSDMEEHHPSRGRGGRQAGRGYQWIRGVLEEVDEAGLIKKDFVLVKNGSVNVYTPSPVSGYVTLRPSMGEVSIWADETHTKLLSRILHLDHYSVKNGQFISRGESVGMQGGRGSANGRSNPHAYQTHTHMELTIEGFNEYLRDIRRGVFASGGPAASNLPAPTHAVVNHPPANNIVKKPTYTPKKAQHSAITPHDAKMLTTKRHITHQQMKEITHEFDKAIELLDELDSLKQNPTGVKIHLGKAGAGTKPTNMAANPFCNKKCKPEESLVAAASVDDGNINIRLDRKVDDAHFIEQAASPMIVHSNELTAMASERMSSVNSSGYGDLFGMAGSGWRAMQFS